MNHPKFTCKHINQKSNPLIAGNLSERTLERWRGIGWGPLFPMAEVLTRDYCEANGIAVPSRQNPENNNGEQSA